MDWKSERVLVTGGMGFFGKHLCDLVGEQMDVDVYRPLSKEDFDLTDWYATSRMFDAVERNAGPVSLVFHLAGWNGGILFNQTYGFDIFSRNTEMAMNILSACLARKVKKVVSVVASCAYPEDSHIPRQREVMVEDDFLDSPPHESVACHGYAKRNLQLASYFINKQYGLNAVCACPTTLYGPGDSFDPDRTKVLGAMVKRFVDAADRNDHEVVCWGSGKAMREFLYVEDAAKMLVQVMEKYDDSELPLNLGTGQEVSIKELAETVARAAGYKGSMRWDTSKPDGQLRKRLDLTRMKQYIDVPITPLEEGIARTVEYYRRCIQG